jgi:hypothetical protein
MHLLAITPGTGFEPNRWASVLGSGIDALLIREPQLPPEAIDAAAAWCLARAGGVRIWVRDRATPGCGLHLPEGSGEGPAGAGVSRPLHAEDQWADRAGAEQVLLSPLFPTPGKGPAWGLERLHRFLEGLPPGGPRILALGGITPERAGTLRHPRLAGLAAIRAFWEGDPAAAVAAFRRGWA